jgi:N6-adenosine-specific RNA methylase IME4
MDTLHERVGPSERARNPLPVLNDFHHDPPGMASPNHRTLSDEFLAQAGGQKFRTVVADPPWQFQNKTGKVAPEHRRLTRYATMTLEEICALPVAQVTAEPAHLYLWVPNALLPDGLRVMAEWGFQYKSNIVWHKIRKDGGSDGRGVGFYFRNVTELILFGVRGKKADEQYELIERCSPGPYLELFSRGTRKGWTVWGNQANEGYRPTWQTYKYNSSNEAGLLQLSA